MGGTVWVRGVDMRCGHGTVCPHLGGTVWTSRKFIANLLTFLGFIARLFVPLATNLLKMKFWKLPSGSHTIECPTWDDAARLRSQINAYNRVAGCMGVVLAQASPKRYGKAEVFVLEHERADFAPWDRESLREGVEAHPEGYFIPCPSEVIRLVRTSASRAGGFSVEAVEGGVMVTQGTRKPRKGSVLRRHLERVGTPLAVSAADLNNARALLSKMNARVGRKRFAVVKAAEGSGYFAVDLDKRVSI